MASIPADYVRSVLQNGVGRYVCQLQRITLKFCKSQADSRGVRFVFIILSLNVGTDMRTPTSWYGGRIQLLQKMLPNSSVSF